MKQPNFLQKAYVWTRELLSRIRPATSSLPPSASQAAGEPVTRKVCLIIFNPTIPSQGGQTLTQVLGWNDSDRLVAELIADLKEVSHGYVNFKVVERIVADSFPVKEDGFAYTGDHFLDCWRSKSGFHQPDAVDYRRIIDTFDLSGKVRRGEIDEVWTYSYPYAGFYESRMVGPGAFWCNAPALENTGESGRRYIIMAFNYQRGVGEALESFGHRSESIMEQVYRGLPAAHEHNYWKRFIRYHKTHPGKAEIGTVHFAPNSLTDYDWGNSTPVPTASRNWRNFPDLAGTPIIAACEEWGGGDIREHHRWWLGLMPHVSGRTRGISHNWWEYIVDPNRVS
jgi:hypothetical protein